MFTFSILGFFTSPISCATVLLVGKGGVLAALRLDFIDEAPPEATKVFGDMEFKLNIFESPSVAESVAVPLLLMSVVLVGDSIVLKNVFSL
jgi:hypothetical protein